MGSKYQPRGPAVPPKKPPRRRRKPPRAPKRRSGRPRAKPRARRTVHPRPRPRARPRRGPPPVRVERIAAPPPPPPDLVQQLERGLAEERERAERKTRELERLNEIGRRLATVLNPGELYQAIYEQMGQLIDTQSMFICLYDEARQRLYFPFYFEDSQRVPPKERPLSHGLTDHVIRSRAPLVINLDYEGTTRSLGIEPFGPTTKCWMGVPMVAEGRVLGVIAIWNRERENLYDESIVRIVQTFANAAAIAVRNAQLYETLHEREETYRTVVETAARAGEGVAIVHVAPGGRTRLAYVNDEFARLTRYSKDELLRMGMEDLVLPDQLPRVLGLEKRGPTQPGQRYESFIVPKDGAPVPIEVSAGQGSLEGEVATVCFVRDITERKRAERELVELKNFNEEIVDSAPVGIAYLDQGGRITYENPALMGIMGVQGPLSPAMNMVLFDHPSVKTQPELDRRLRALLRGEAFEETTYAFHALTGKDVEIAVSGVPLVRNGEVSGALLLIRDVTEFRRYERALVEQKNFNQNIVENAPIGIAYLDEEGRVTYENPYLLRIMGHTPGELPRGWFSKVVELPSMQGKPGFRERIEGLLRGKAFDGLTLPYTSLYGREIVANVAGVPLREGGRVKGAVLLIEDVTVKVSLEERLKHYTERLEQMVEERTGELRAANRELEEAKRSLETILASTADGIAALDPHGHLIFHNAKFAELAGTDELQGKALSDVLRPLGQDRAKDFLRSLAALEDGEPLRALELGFQNGRGEVIHAVLNALPLLKGGRVASIVATLTDITDRKRLEDELRRYTQSLEEEVARRTARLIQSAKMAALGQLVAGVAHEINNPLAYVKSNTENLLDAARELRSGPLAKALEEGGVRNDAELAPLLESEELRFLLGDAAHLLENNMRGLDRIAQIVLQLRNFASPQMGRLQQVDLNATVRETVALFAPQFNDRIDIHGEYGDVPPVKCDTGQITQVIMNLLVNAGQAIKSQLDKEGDAKRRGHIWVRTRRREPWVEVEVRDDGPGIPPDILPKIWDPFFTTKEKGNTGLGLSISYNILHEHGGEIKVETQVGRGTAFTVRLPLERGHV
jgi:two-component system, NtrC family, sensor kinase